MYRIVLALALSFSASVAVAQPAQITLDLVDAAPPARYRLVTTMPSGDYFVVSVAGPAEDQRRWH